MAEDCDSQESIKFYLEAFLQYICESVTATDLLVHVPSFSKAERKEIFALSTRKPLEATKSAIEILLKKNEPGVYRTIKEVMGPEQADVPKIFLILSGKLIPSQEEDQYRAIIQLFMSELIDRVNPVEIIPHLNVERALSAEEIEEIKCEDRNHGRRKAAWLLLYYLPQRVEDWFKLFLKALIAQNQHDLARKLDPVLYEKIMAQCEDSHRLVHKDNTEEKETLLEVFVDAVDDLDLLNAVEEKYDQEKSEKETGAYDKEFEVENEHKVPNTKEVISVPVSVSEVHMKTDETSLKVSIESTEKAIKDNDSLQDNGRSSSEFKVKTTVSSPVQSVDELAKGIQQFASVDNLNTSREVKQPYMKTLQTVKSPSQLPKPDKRTRLSVYSITGILDTSVESVKIDKSGGQAARPKSRTEVSPGSTLKYDSKYLRRLQHSKLATYPLQAFLRLPELFDSESKSNNAAPFYEIKDNFVMPSRSLLPVYPVDKSLDDREGHTLSDERSLKILLDSLTNIVMGGNDGQDDTKTIYSRTEEKNDTEAMNDLNTETDSSHVSTDVNNIETQTETEIPLRSYQHELAEIGCQGENVIILAPTNSGKTYVACRIIQEHFRRSKGHRIAKCAFVVENTSLAQQQGELCAKLLGHLRTKIISGETQRDKREFLKDFVDRRDILVVTAKVLHNTLKQKEINSITKFSLIIFDECHHTQLEHPYNEIMHIYFDAKTADKVEAEALPQIVGLTASLGVGKEVTIEKAVKHMQSLMANLDSRSLCRVRRNLKEMDQYQNSPDEEIVIVPRRANDFFRLAVTEVMQAIEVLIGRTREQMIPVDVGIINKILKSVPAHKGSLPYIQWLSDLRRGLVELHSDDMRRVVNSCRLHLLDYNQAVLLYEDARSEDALEILKKSMEERRNPANTQIEQIMFQIYDKLTEMDFKECSFNPKLIKLQEILIDVLGRNEDARGIIFVKTRQLAEYLIKWMKSTGPLRELNPTVFVGQTASVQVGGMTKHEQKDVLVYFKDGLHKLIVATSVAEEGLDITKCNLVIRYEHVTNEIVRTQSRGRARAPNSRYYVVTVKGSPIADKEEKNAQSEKLMNDAVLVLEQIIERNRNNFEIRLNKLQTDAKIKRTLKEKKKYERRAEGDFEFRCFNCDQFICMSSDIRKIQGSHHVCVADDVTERVIFQRSPLPEYVENDMKMDGATYCLKCMQSLGGVCDYKGIEFPLMKIQQYRLVDRNGKGSHTKKWKGAPCKVQEIDLVDLLHFVHQNRDSD